MVDEVVVVVDEVDVLLSMMCRQSRGFGFSSFFGVQSRRAADQVD